MLRFTYWTVGTIVVLAVPTTITVMKFRKSVTPKERNEHEEAINSDLPNNVIDPESLL